MYNSNHDWRKRQMTDTVAQHVCHCYTITKTPADNCIPQYAIQTSPSWSVSQKGQVFLQYLTLRFVDNYSYRYSLYTNSQLGSLCAMASCILLWNARSIALLLLSTFLPHIVEFEWQVSHASWKVLDFFLEHFRTWKVMKNHFGPGKSWKLMLKVLESPGKYPWKSCIIFLVVQIEHKQQ